MWEAYVYDGWNMVLSVKLNPEAGASQGRPQSAIASYVWRPDLGSQPFARRNWQAAGGVRGLVMANYFTGANGGGIHLPVMDTMGNVTQVVRAGVQLNYNGDSMRSEFVYDYDAFGKETRSSTLVAGLNPDSFPFHYSTKFTDPESGFNYYGYRFYDPANGRWINRDPIGEGGGRNLYGMVGNDPISNIDILGLVETIDTRAHKGCKCKKEDIDKIGKEFSEKAANLTKNFKLPADTHTAGGWKPERPEFGGNICCNSNTGVVSATAPTQGKFTKRPERMDDGKFIYEGGAFNPDEGEQCPRGTENVASYHSHPDGSSFSKMGKNGLNGIEPSDDKWVFKNSKPLFLGNQAGQQLRLDMIQVFTPGQGYGPMQFPITNLTN